MWGCFVWRRLRQYSLFVAFVSFTAFIHFLLHVASHLIHYYSKEFPQTLLIL